MLLRLKMKLRNTTVFEKCLIFEFLPQKDQNCIEIQRVFLNFAHNVVKWDFLSNFAIERKMAF